MKRSWAFWLIPAWLVFVVSLAIWWMLFSLRKIEQLGQYVQDPKLSQEHNMLLAEGGVLVVSLLAGGLALIYYALREKRRLQDVKLFFSSFTHDLKTSLARLALQGERLGDKNSAQFKVFHKNLIDLERQLENSLHISQAEVRELYLEKVNIPNVFTRLHSMWPDLKLNLQGQNEIISDQSAIESIFKNLISNSIKHGKATEVSLMTKISGGTVEMSYSDDGKAEISNELMSMGTKLMSSREGTGVGLYLVRQWVKSLDGDLQFSKDGDVGLNILIRFPERGL